MTSRQRIIPILDGNVRIADAREPRDVGHTVREFLKFALAISAVGSAAFGAYQAYLQTEISKTETAATRRQEAKPKKSFFEILIEADREALKNHEPLVASPLLTELRGAILPGGGQAEPSGAKPNLRSMFAPTAQGAKPGVNSWNIAFLTDPQPRAIVAPPAQPATPANPARPQANAAPATPPRPTPPPQPNASSNAPASAPASAPARPQAEAAPAARPQLGFTEAKRAAPPPRPDTTATAAGDRFAEVHMGAPKQQLRPNADDMDFANAQIRAAEKDFHAVQPAQAVVAEFVRRYPKTAEAEVIVSRMRQAQAAHAEALSERTSIGPDTQTAALQFAGDSAQAIRACLARASELERLAAIVRPVRHDADKPAFLVSATVNQSWRGAFETREAHLAAARQRLTAQIGPCLAPLLTKGTVSLSLGDGEGSDMTAQRIEATPGAVLFQRTDADAKATGQPAAAPPVAPKT